MNQAGMIVSIVSILACLFLVTRNGRLGNLPGRKVLRLALVWGAILLGLVAILQLTGLHRT